VHKLGGYRLQARKADDRERLLADARALAEAGCFSLVLEKVPAEVAKRVTAELSIPTIGIGAGPDCDGQVLVLHDMLGMSDAQPLKFVKQYAHLHADILKAVTAYSEEVRSGKFPDEEHTFHVEK
jgi:3-methyl-2-oxobutanoate hydroxymethyltransferase